MDDRNILSKNSSIILFFEPGTEWKGNLEVNGDVYFSDRCSVLGNVTANNVYFCNRCNAKNIMAKGNFICGDGNSFNNILAEGSVKTGSYNIFEAIRTKNNISISDFTRFGELYTESSASIGLMCLGYCVQAKLDVSISFYSVVDYIFSERNVYAGACSCIKNIEADGLVKLAEDVKITNIYTFGKVLLGIATKVFNSIVAESVEAEEPFTPNCVITQLVDEIQKQNIDVTS